MQGEHRLCWKNLGWSHSFLYQPAAERASTDWLSAFYTISAVKMSLEGQIDWLVAGCYLGEARSCPLSSEAHLGVSKEFKNAWLPTAVLGTPGNLCLQHMWGSSFWSCSNMGLRLQGWSTEDPEAVALYEVAGLLTAFHLTPPKPTEKWLFAELVNSQTATGSGLLKCSPCLFVFSGSPWLYPSHMAQVMGKLHLSPPLPLLLV